MRLSDLCVAPPEPGPADWNDDGYVVANGLLPDQLIERYKDAWRAAHGWDWPAREPGGWPDCTPYMRVPELLDLCTYTPMVDIMTRLVGEPVGVHLNLTGWVSTERDWHQDTYLNPPDVGDFYVAVWMCLDQVHEEAGPFQIVPGSHRWPVVTREKILAALAPHERTHEWPKFSERILTPLFTDEIQRRGAKVLTFLPRRGDCLFWHGRTLHRGSRPAVPGTYRGACIAHCSGINHRPDMPQPKRHGEGWFFPIQGGPV